MPATAYSESCPALNVDVEAVSRDGWRLYPDACAPSDIRGLVLQVAHSLGALRRPYQAADAVQALTPSAQPAARCKNSLSGRYGLDAFPCHTDDAQHPTPARFVVLGCEASDASVSTRLLRWSDVSSLLSSEESWLLTQPLYLVAGARRSFLSPVRDRDWLRFDVCCMTARTFDARLIFERLSETLARQSGLNVHWRPGDLLILDNWNSLHGRSAAHASADRTLWRALVN